MAVDNPPIHGSPERFSIVPWKLIPDLGLYMDQVVTFISSIYEPLYGEDIHRYLSPSMINNYVKSKLIPRPVGKKYSRSQIALLTMIVALKQTCSMEEIRRLLTPEEGETVEALYASFSLRYTSVINFPGDLATGGMAPPRSALDLAILASGYSACCTMMLKAASV
ncbi:MAG: DUF1836 domain-containing protein [Clostridia bacterium]|nr:DUF1836 domain-containing protein [Clostridia bacterium]